MFIYLDSAASHPPHPRLAEWYAELLPQCLANPHGGTCFAEACRRIALDAEQRLLSLLDIPSVEAQVIWTSGVTEALNLAATAIPPDAPCWLDPGAHQALSAPLQQRSRNCRFLAYDTQGAIIPPTNPSPCALAAISHLNNETGQTQSLTAIRQWCGCSPVLSVDAAQSFCRIPIPWTAAHIDLLALSSRKIGGPAAAGALIRRRSVKLSPVLKGGGQQNNLRSGTLDVCGIALFVRIAEDVWKHHEENQRRIAALHQHLQYLVQHFGHGARLVSQGQPIAMLHIPGYEGAVVSRILAQDYGILVSASSACTAEHGNGSISMQAMGYTTAQSKEAIRITLDASTTTQQLDALFQALQALLRTF